MNLFLKPFSFSFYSIPESIGKQISKVAQGVYPLQNVFIRKVKVLKTPKFDAAKILELHGEGQSEDTGKKVAAAKKA